MSPTTKTDGSRATSKYAGAKVPEITPWFWATKIVMTATGEAISDAMNQQLGPGIAVPIMLIFMVIALRWQFKQPAYRALPYWSVVAAISVFGTSAADAFHVGLGWPYWLSTSFYAVVLTCVLTYWYRSEGTLSIHSIINRRRETVYWLTVLATFALGTAVGDFTAVNLGLDYLPSFILFGLIILIPWMLYQRGVNPIFSFWFAYTLTRPFGASWADWNEQPLNAAGLNLGQIPTAIYLAAISLALVFYMLNRQIGSRAANAWTSGEVEPALSEMV